MTREEVYARLKDVFNDVFDREIELNDNTTAADVDGWDSMTHITLIGTIEDEFNVKFPMDVVIHMKSVGDIVTRILDLSE